jgi:hypothetical protein
MTTSYSLYYQKSSSLDYQRYNGASTGRLNIARSADRESVNKIYPGAKITCWRVE